MAFNDDDPSGERLGSAGSRVPADVQAEALGVIEEVLRWQLPEARWPGIERILGAIDAALVADDPEALTAAAARLELAGPLRAITRIGGTPVVPPPPPLRDRLNQLVFALGGVSLGPQQPTAEDKGAGEDAARGS